MLGRAGQRRREGLPPVFGGMEVSCVLSVILAGAKIIQLCHTTGEERSWSLEAPYGCVCSQRDFNVMTFGHIVADVGLSGKCSHGSGSMQRLTHKHTGETILWGLLQRQVFVDFCAASRGLMSSKLARRLGFIVVTTGKYRLQEIVSLWGLYLRM